ncbi:hypothetical protein MBLNU459_g5556t1 [Dothideomycetes sp. NU459]
MDNLDAIYQPGDDVPWHFVPGIVVGAFFASLTGTVLTVELLHKKRLGKSLKSRLQLFSCALSMGLIGIWCMHFIGNASIELAHGQSALQLHYSPGFTVLSCILPVIGLSFAFYIAEIRIDSSFFRRLVDALSGLFAGLSIMGMHYVGNLGTSNYKLHYPTRFIVAAAIIAVGDCMIALSVFFYFKEKWISIFWKRLVCAIILAIAVCGMHFTATVGCTYELKNLDLSPSSNRHVAVIVAAVLCIVAGIALLTILFLQSRRASALAKRAQQVMLACAFFDEHGNIMVTNEGLLPSQKIAERFSLSSFDEALDAAHPVFQWLWRVSHSWGSVSDKIDKMRHYIANPSRYEQDSSPIEDEEIIKDNTTLFRASFCVAAADLANRIQGDLSQLGNLFDEVFTTGTIEDKRQSVEKPDRNEKGQYLMFARRISAKEMSHFTDTCGFRFAPIIRVAPKIAKTVQISDNALHTQLIRLEEFTKQTETTLTAKEGVYMSAFTLLSHLQGQSEVVVRRNNRCQIPDVRLAPNQLTEYQADYLKKFDRWPAEQLSTTLQMKVERTNMQIEERSFVTQLVGSLLRLEQDVGEEWFGGLVFNASPITARQGITIYGFTKVINSLNGPELPKRLMFVPLDFFALRQHYYPGCADQGKMQRSVHAEFGPLLSDNAHTDDDNVKLVNGSDEPVELPDSNSVKRCKSSKTVFSETKSIMSSDYESDLGAETVRGDPAAGTDRLWGGILAVTDTVIIKSAKVENIIEMPQVTAYAFGDKGDEKTFVDVLQEMAASQWLASTRPSESSR